MVTPLLAAVLASGCDPFMTDPEAADSPQTPPPSAVALASMSQSAMRASSASVTSFLGTATTPEEFISGLPELYLERFGLIYTSHSPAQDHVSPRNPRVVSWGPDGRTIFAWNTNPEAPAPFRESVEFLQQGRDRWSAGIIDFSGEQPTVTEPTSCQTCHGSLNKPLWGRYLEWPGGEYPNKRLATASAANYMRQLLASTNPRITPLSLSEENFLYGNMSSRFLRSPGRRPYVSAMAEGGAVMAWRHAEVLLAELESRHSNLRQYSQDLICRNSENAYAVSDHLVRKNFAQDDHNLAVMANVDDSHFRSDASYPGRRGRFSGGVLGEGAQVEHGYAFQSSENVGTTMLFLMLVELWEQEPILRKLYRQTDLRTSYNFDYERSGTAEEDLRLKLDLHFGQGSREQLDRRAEEHVTYLNNAYLPIGDIPSATFWGTHIKQMQSPACRALRQSSPQEVSVEIHGSDPVVRWRTPESAEWLSGLRGYRILRGAGEGSPQVVVDNTATTDSVWTDATAPAGEHFWVVHALYDDSLYASPASSEARITVPARTAQTAGPVVSGTKSFTVVEGDTEVGTLAATDDDTSSEDLTWLVSGGADGAMFSLTSAGVLAFTAAKDFEAPDDDDSDGSYELSVAVSDGSKADTADITVALSNRNEAPTADAGADQSGIAEGATVTLSATGSDPDAGDALTFTWTQTSGTTVTLSTPTSASTTFTAPNGLSDDVELEFSLRVRDAGGLYADDAVTVTVVGTAAPVVSGSKSFTVLEGDTEVGTLAATDDDTAAEELTWLVSGGADGGAFSLSSAGALAFTAAKDFEAPDDDDADGSYELTVVVSDGSKADTAHITVALSNRNEAPTADAGADRSGIAEGATVTLSGAGSDPDAGDALTYAWTQASGTTVTLSAPSSASTTFTAPNGLSDDVELEFSLRVTDAGGLYDDDAVTVTVVGTAAPVVSGSKSFTVLEGDTEVGTLSATDDDTAAGELTWLVSGGADGGAFSLSSAGALAFTAAKDFEAPDDDDADGSYELTVVVSDGSKADTADITVALSNRNEAPTADAGADQSGIAEGATVALSGAGSDPDASDPLTFAWTQTRGTTVTLSTPASASTTFTAPNGLSDDAELEFSLRVTDAGGLYDDDAVAVTVEADEQATFTARFDSIPDTHDGLETFAFELYFSEEAPLSFRTLRDTSFTVTNGRVTSARRLNPPSNIGWEIQVAPTEPRDITITLPGGRACGTAGALCTSDGRALQGTVQETVTADALTARLDSIPDTHNGSTRFTFELHFSEEVDLGYETLRDESFTVTNGRVTSARRLNRPSNIGWEIEVRPTASQDITITLPRGRACDAAGAVCTKGGKRLANEASAIVRVGSG